MSKQRQVRHRCPFLGDDTRPKRGHPYPHDAHRCWAKGTPATIPRRRQAQHCLRDAHTRCPIFTALIPQEQISVRPDTAPTQALIALLDEPPRRRPPSRPHATTSTRATHGHLLRKLRSQTAAHSKRTRPHPTERATATHATRATIATRPSTRPQYATRAARLMPATPTPLPRRRASLWLWGFAMTPMLAAIVIAAFIIMRTSGSSAPSPDALAVATPFANNVALAAVPSSSPPSPTATPGSFIPLLAITDTNAPPFDPVAEATVVAQTEQEKSQTGTDQPNAPLIATPGPFPPPATSPPSRLIIPAINLASRVVPVGTYLVQQGNYLVRYYQVAEYAVGWHEDSALPGARGNTVMAGHNNTKGEVFRDLWKLEPGDMVYVEADGRLYAYQVALKKIVREVGVPLEQQFENARWIAPTNDIRLTLVSCWPYESNTHRVIIVAVPFGTNVVTQ
nr:sortase [Ardenticatena sp.]